MPHQFGFADLALAIANGTGSAGQVLQSTGATTPPVWVAPAPAPAATGLVAAGTTQGTALLIANLISQVAVVGAGTGVRLPTGVAAGRVYEVWNDGANDLLIYPESGGQIGTLAVDAATTVGPNVTVRFLKTGPGPWSVR